LENMTENLRSVSLWMASVSDDLTPRRPLDSDIDVDVAIAGAGYTGLWTAYYLSRTDPSLRIAVVEKNVAGFGASGRNGGWASAAFSAHPDKLAASAGRESAYALQRAMIDTVDEIAEVCSQEGIDAHYVKGGSLTAATSPAHAIRLEEEVAEARRWGFGPEDVRWLEPKELAGRLKIAGARGAVYTPHCAAVHPARLVRGLARAVEGRGVDIYEQTEVLDLSRGAMTTNRGAVRAQVVVRALEGYTSALSGLKRALVPLYSLMIATQPLPRSFWDDVGWNGRETLSDGRHLIIYAQRTADDRIAIGGRGAPYHFGSRVEDRFDTDPKVFEALHRTLRSLFPALGEAAITHGWGGPLALPRDWFSSVTFDRTSGLAWAGGYVGDGVATSNLAGRTLADLICGRDTDITRLPWVGHRSRRWEPEPFRWLGANLALRTMASADAAEARTGRPARRAALARRLIGN
jgi:glycine/D-amino acid oxidase-like deaminating enzyme